MIRVTIYTAVVCWVMTIALVTLELYKSQQEPFDRNKQTVSEMTEQSTQGSIDTQRPRQSVETRSIKEPEGELGISTVKNSQSENPIIPQTEQKPVHITVTAIVGGLRNLRGQIIAQIFDKEHAFDNNQYDQAISTVITPASNDTVELMFKNLPKAEYAMMLFHDENSNQQFDQSKTLLEGYAFSNNTGRNAPVKFQQAAFNAAEDKKITLNLIYH